MLQKNLFFFNITCNQTHDFLQELKTSIDSRILRLVKFYDKILFSYSFYISFAWNKYLGWWLPKTVYPFYANSADPERS